METHDIIRITIKSESGYCSAEDAYNDKVTITRGSIQYEYKPLYASEMNTAQNWSYKTSNPDFQKRFDELVVLIPAALKRQDDPFVTDIGAITFLVTYADKTKKERTFFLLGDEFRDLFFIIRQMVPSCECIPMVLQT